MKQNTKVKTLSMAILDTAIKLGIKDGRELVEVMSLSMVDILCAVSSTTTLPPKEVARIYVDKICKSYDL